MKTILTAVDLSSTSNSVVAHAVALARSTKDRIVLLTVVQPPVAATGGEYAPAMNLAEIAAAGEQAAAAHLIKLQKRLHTEGIPSKAIQATGAPVPHILAQAKKNTADYIVMGSHGHTAFYDLLVGSTTHGVLRRANCPVVIVPPPKKKRARRSRK